MQKVDAWQGHWLGGVGVHHGVTLPYLRHVSSYDKDIWIAATDYYVLLHNSAISINSSSSVNKSYSFILIRLLINAVILLLDGLVLILYLYIHFLSLRHYFLYLNIIWAFVYLLTLL